MPLHGLRSHEPPGPTIPGSRRHPQTTARGSHSVRGACGRSGGAFQPRAARERTAVPRAGGLRRHTRYAARAGAGFAAFHRLQLDFEACENFMTAAAEDVAQLLEVLSV